MQGRCWPSNTLIVRKVCPGAQRSTLSAHLNLGRHVPPLPCTASTVTGRTRPEAQRVAGDARPAILSRQGRRVLCVCRPADFAHEQLPHNF
jgi:hypothetical protein